MRSTAVMASPISSALASRWIEDGTADEIIGYIRAESAARQAIATELLTGLEYRYAPNAFNVGPRPPKSSDFIAGTPVL